MAQKPPKDVEPSELFLKLLEPQPAEVIDFPRKGHDGKPISQIRIRVLSQEEHDSARIRAFSSLKAKGFSPDDLQDIGMREVVGDRVAKELIAIACTEATSNLDDAATGQPIYARVFHSADDVGKLRAHEVSVLFNAYILVQDKWGPREHDTDVDAWVNRLAEGGNAFPLLSLDLPDLVELATSLAERVSTICHVLGSQWSTLPSTCQSDLERYCMGIGSWCEQQENCFPAALEKSEVDVSLESAVDLERRTASVDRVRDLASED